MYCLLRRTTQKGNSQGESPTFTSVSPFPSSPFLHAFLPQRLHVRVSVTVSREAAETSTVAPDSLDSDLGPVTVLARPEAAEVHHLLLCYELGSW